MNLGEGEAQMVEFSPALQSTRGRSFGARTSKAHAGTSKACE